MKHNTIGKGSSHRAVNGGLDQYFTPRAVADDFIAQIKRQAPKKANWIEPSAGAGVFIKAAKAQGISVQGYDLDPQLKSIQKQDFFAFEYTKKDPAVVVGNPPFGFAASMAVKFFNHAAQFANVIAFVVPASFCKGSIKNRLNLCFECVYEEKQVIDFEFPDGGTKAVPCVKQIWKRLPNMQQRTLFEDEDHGQSLGISFLKPSNAKQDEIYSMIAVRRVGGRAGQYIPECEGSEGTTYFMVVPKAIKKLLMSAKYKKAIAKYIDNTAGVRSISKPELIAAIKEAL